MSDKMIDDGRVAALAFIFCFFCLWLQGCLGKSWDAGFGAVALNELLQLIDLLG